ncbi:MAG: amino acid permease [Micavibrio sp.]|nr:amino acid permease [Micavibrio sp.]
MQSMFSRATLFRTKRPDADLTRPSGLLPVLTAWDLTLLGIGCIIGTGIFVLTGIAAAEQAGPAVVLSFVVSGFACAFAALAYAELSSSVGGCGSAYGYSYAAFGEFMAWIIGWDLVLEYGVSVAAVANGWSGYFNTGLAGLTQKLHDWYGLNIDLTLPMQLTRGPFAHDPVTHLATPGIVNLPAVAIILILMGILIVGIKQSARLNTVMVIVKLSTIAIFLAVSVGHIQPSLWTPFMPFGWFDTLPDGKTVGVLAGASVVFFAYVGFDAVSTAVEEAKNPSRDVPIGILSSLVFCTIIYIIVSGVLTGIVPYSSLNVKEGSPVAYALQQIGFNGASILVSTGVIFGLTTVMLVLYYGLTRIIFAMSRDGLLPATLGEVNEKTHTPVRTTVICGVVMAVMAGFIPLGTLAELVNIGTLVAFVLVCIGVIVLRRRYPDMKRPFEAPFGILIPILGVLSCGALVFFLPFLTQLRFVLWLLVGLVIYFAYSVHHSKLRADTK